MNTAAAEAVTCYQRIFHGRPDQVSAVRADIARHLAGSPVISDAILIASELAANAVVHSASKDEFFTLRCERHPDYVWVEAEDLGGPWQHNPPDDLVHGLGIISALAGPDNWGTETTGDGDRIVWARLDLPLRDRKKHPMNTPHARATPPEQLTDRVFRALYPGYDLLTMGVLHIVTPKGTPLYISDSLGHIARQLTTPEPPGGTPGQERPGDNHAILPARSGPGTART